MEQPQKNSPPEKAAAFEVREGALPARLGISRDVLRYLRQQLLTEGVHFARLAKKIHYTEAGVEILRQRLDLGPEEFQKLIQASREKTPPPPVAADNAAPRPNTAQHPIVTLKVWRNFSSQRDGVLRYNGILHAYKPGDDPAIPDNLLRVTVRSGENYVRHMEIPCRHIAGDVYECARPDPRWRGTW